MTHALVEAAATVLAENQCQHLFAALPDEVQQAFREDAQRIVAALLRHPAMREPSEGVVDAAFNAQPIPSMRAPKGWMTTAWRAGCDALAREIEEASR